MGKIVLGLDLGPNSIGWALVDEADENIVACGVRVFPEGVDNFDTKKEKPKNESRRIARGMRRQIARRARRRANLRRVLVAFDLWPNDSDQQEALLSCDPYELRRRALSEKLAPFEIGRVLIHLNQRRGFLSNRKSDRERAKETQGMLAEINELAAEIEKSEQRTLGAYLSVLHTNPHQRLRGRHTRRSMLQDEFNAVWESQQDFHGELLNADRRAKLHRAIFFQRELYWPKSVIGRCELEPKRRRCPRADRRAQRFRLLQEVNNLKYLEPKSRDELSLTPDQRKLLLSHLERTKEMTFDQIRKKLGFLESIKFNLERGDRGKLKGHVTDATLADKKLFGPEWYKRSEAERTAIVQTLLHDENEDRIVSLAQTEWGLDCEAAERLADIELAPGYIRLSTVALDLLLPHMESGLLYMTGDDRPSALSEAGYLRPDQRRTKLHLELPEPPEVTNPVVRQALHEVRKVANAIIREYGRPAEVRLELAREAKATSEERKQINSKMREREAQRNLAAEEIRNLGFRVTRDAIERYLLWQEQRQMCPYSQPDRTISVHQLFSGEVDIDHILPYSQCLDNSFANKVVCFRSANSDKGQRTPVQWLAEREPERYEKVWQRVAHLPFNKRKRFAQKTVELDDFVARQLNDTRYISRQVLEYLRLLYEQPHQVLCVKGQQTAELRWQWGVNTVLRHDDVNLKNRDDHRHHTVDAIVLALTDHRHLQDLAKAYRHRAPDDPPSMPTPWTTFRTDAEVAVNTINVSHRVQRKVAGALHKDTLYGPTSQPGVFVYRKPLASLTSMSMVESIRDPTIRSLVLAHLEAKCGLKPGDRKAIPSEAWKTTLAMPSGVPIRKVRVTRQDETIQPLRGDSCFVKPGSNHHICIFEFDDKRGKRKREAIFASTLDAARRIVSKHPVVSRIHPRIPNAKFVMSLARGEMILANINGRQALLKLRKSKSTEKRLFFAEHNDSRKSDSIKLHEVTLNNIVSKVTVDPIGRIRWAND